MMMNTGFQSRLTQLLIRCLFILVPTIVIAYVTLTFMNLSYTAFSSGILTQSIFFASGLVAAYSLYYFRARWLVTFGLLWVVYYFITKIIVKLPGEFDVFYATARFELFSALFLFGWAFGFLLVRLKYSFVILVGVMAIATIATVSGTVDVSMGYILLHLVPVVVYGLYMLFITPLVTTPVEMDLGKSVRLVVRFALFVILTIAAFIFVQRFLQEDLKAVERELAARGAKDKDNKGKDEGKSKKDKGYDQRYGLMDKGKNGDDGYRLKDTMRVNSKMSQSDVLMFCSKLDSYYEDGSPKPMYFVYHYLTRYDPARETFTRDVNVPYFDEFDADPSKVEVYHSIENTSLINQYAGRLGRSVVEAKVYLSSNTWKHSLLAPGGAFYLQSIPVEKDFQKTYYAAYKVRSWASELNNAYFVYNPSANPMLEMIQQQRIDELQHVRSYAGLDTAFMNYYTRLPNGPLYDSIRHVTTRLTDRLASPIDKVIAVRDYFLQRDENGKRVFRYTLKPGNVNDPNIPTATMLGNFLFKSHAGYCTYYAGASLFMLRAMGIPSRFTTGFAAVNRNDKNKGWYWFYASQAHAWTQVYFPEYGWLDFDMTIGNEDQHEAPKPDGTPPLPPPEPWLVLNSSLASGPDLKTKKLDVNFQQLIYFDEGYQLRQPVKRTIDASTARVLYDKKDTTLAFIQPGDSLIIVSFKNEARSIPKPRPGISIDDQVAQFPALIIADEIHIKLRAKVEKKKEADKKKTEEKDQSMTWQEILMLAAKIAGGVIALIFLFPLLYLLWLFLNRAFAGEPLKKADAVYNSALYQFHMSGLERRDQTPLQYAQARVDPIYDAGFTEFMKVYLRIKYSTEGETADDQNVILLFAGTYGKAIRRKLGIIKTVAGYFNPLLANRFFLRNENPEEIN